MARYRIEWVIALLFGVANLRIAHGAGELEGQIRGRVVEAATDAPVPGATVTATAPNLGYPRTVTTGDDGEFSLPNLPVGSYTVTVSYAGMKPITRAVLVQAGVTTPLNIQWSIEMAEAETTTIIEQRPVTNPGSTQTGGVVSVELERHTPGSHGNYFDLVQQVPGVRRGTQGRNYEPFINGGRESDNRYYVDGLEVTDMVTRFSNQRVAIEGLDSIQLITGGFDAEYNAFGGVFNAITREGSDEWHGRVSSYLRNSALYNSEPTGAGLEETTRPFDTRPRDRTWQSYNAVNLTGPLIKHRFWFSGTFEYRYSTSPRRPGPPLNLPTSPPEIENRYLGMLKLSAALSPKHRLTLSLMADPLYQSNVSSGNRLNTYQAGRDEGGYNGILSWSFFPRSDVELHIDAGVRTWHRNEGPSGYFGSVDTSYCEMFSKRNCAYDREAPTHVNDLDGSRWYNSDTQYTRDRRYSFQLDPKVTWRSRWFGEHSTKLGAQLKYLRRTRYRHTPGNLTYEDNQARTAGPLEEGLCDPDAGKTAGCYQRTFDSDRNYTNQGYDADVFFQDWWYVNRWLTITPGIRVDYGRAKASDGKIFNSQFGYGPRIGIVVDITRDQKTIFSTNYGRSNLINHFDQVENYDNNVQNVSRTERWNSTTNQWEFTGGSGGAEGTSFVYNTPVEHVDQITTSIRREVFRNTAVEVGHVWKRQVSMWQSQEVNRIFDPTGYRIVDFRDGQNHNINQYATYNNSRNYNAFNFGVQSRPTENWYFLGYYTLAWLWGENVSDVPTQNRFQAGFIAGDRTADIRHRINFAASYTFPFGVILGAKLEHTSGQATTKRFRRFDGGSPTRYRSPQGTSPGTCSGTYPDIGTFSTETTACGNSVNLISELRSLPQTLLDLQLEYDLYRWLRQHIALSFELFDILSERSADTLNRDDTQSGNFGSAASRPSGLETRIGVRWDF